MFLASTCRIFKFSSQDFWRNIWLSIITITILVFTFISISFLIILNVISGTAIKTVEEKVDVSVYFKPEVGENEILSLKSYLSSLPEVKEVQYISKEQALEKFKEMHKDDPVIQKSLEELGKNPLTASFIIKSDNVNNYPKIIEQLDQSEYNQIVESKNFAEHKEIIGKVSNITDRIKVMGLAVSAIFVIIACLIVFNSVRIMIYTHREEINIMKLVGASNWFVKSPYLIQAVIYSVIACLITIILVYPLAGVINPYISSFFGADFNLIVYLNQHAVQIFGSQLLLIVLLTLISSSIALKRYLKV